MVKEGCEELGDTKSRVSLMMLMMLIAMMWRGCPGGIEGQHNCFQKKQVVGRVGYKQLL